MSTRSTTYAKGEDRRNMTRSTLVRHLRSVPGVMESKTLKRRVFDDTTMGWKVNWTNSRYADTYVSWEKGTVRNAFGPTTREEIETVRNADLDKIEAALKALGYVTKRESAVILVLRRMGA